ncbi:MAG: ATP-binding protein, partial [bacterium]
SSQLTEEVVRTASQLSETVRRSTRYSMLRGENRAVEEILKAIGNQERIEACRIFGNDGAVVYSSSAEEVGKKWDMQARPCQICHSELSPLERLNVPVKTMVLSSERGHSVLSMVNPIYNEPSCSQASCHYHPASQKVLGVLEIEMSLAGVDAQAVRASYRIVFFAILSILCVSTLIGIFMRRSVVRPIKNLITGTEKISEGDFSHRIPVGTTDELGVLARCFNDMTEKLERASKAFQLAGMGKLAAEFAHEVNNPLTNVLTSASLLLEKAGDDDPDKEELEIVVSESIRCREIIKGLLNLAKQVEPEMKVVNVNSIIRRTISLIENQVSFYNIQMIKNLDKTLPRIMADEHQIQRVFLNMIQNASDAMPRGGRLVISTCLSPDRQMIEIRFQDTGSGMDEATLGKIFDPFFTTKESGTGLGLTISQKVVSAHGGKIEATSKVGEGTTFLIRLPITPMRGDSSREESMKEGANA